MAGFTDWQYRLLGPPNLQSPSDCYTHRRAICFPDHSVNFQNPVYPGSRPILLYLPLQTHSTTLQNLTPMCFSSMNFLCTCYIVVDKIHIHSHFLLSTFQCCRSWTAKNHISASLAARQGSRYKRHSFETWKVEGRGGHVLVDPAISAGRQGPGMGSFPQPHRVFSPLDSSSSVALIPVGLWGSTFDLTSDGSLLILPSGLWQRC